MSKFGDYIAARWAEPTTKASLAATLVAVGGAMAGGQDWQALGLIALSGLAGAMCPEAKPVLEGLIKVLKEGAGTGAAITLALGVCGTMGLAACTAAQESQGVQIACEVDGTIQPGVALLLSGEVATLDQLLVHPAVVAACGALGGVPTAARP